MHTVSDSALAVWSYFINGRFPQHTVLLCRGPNNSTLRVAHLEKTPFSVYDFFAYLSAGAVLVVTIDYINGSALLASQTISPFLAVVLILASYVLGQIVAQFSSLVLENWLVRRLLGLPTSILMGEAPRSRLLLLVFPGYHRALPTVSIERVRAQAAERGCSANGDGLFLHCYAVTTASIVALQSRLDDFRTQYGFARNMAFAFGVSGLVIAAYSSFWPHLTKLRWSLVAFLASTGMLYRYLKFFRQYSYELLLRYAELSNLPERAKEK